MGKVREMFPLVKSDGDCPLRKRKKLNYRIFKYINYIGY